MENLAKTFAFLYLSTCFALGLAASGKVVCFYDSKGAYREDSAKFLIEDLEQALPSCTHVIYGYAKIDETDFRMKAMDQNLDTESGKDNYKMVTALKKRFPGVPFLLSVGGWADKEGDNEKYLTLLRDPNHRGTFVSSARALVHQYGFDGVDLAWQFPLVRVKQRSTLGSIWHKIKKTFGYAKGSKDLNAEENRAGFTALIKQLKLAMRSDGYLVTASVIPHTNYTYYYEPKEIASFLDGVHLFAFDFSTPERKITPEVADYPAPLYPSEDRNPEFNAEFMVNWFVNQSTPGNKIILGIPSYGRSWRLKDDPEVAGVPPLEADGPGAEGHLTHTRGILSYPEICAMLSNPNNHGTKGLLHKVADPTKKLGTYAYRKDEDDREGIWVGYEDPDTTALKAAYARNKGLGGVAIVDITMDDFKGVCNGNRFPLLKAAKDAI